ncbi:2-isopropylmalate synthase [Nitzschia inconspicua]|uniref:2-isopropylmalate synthase n=1 Tax=Nitzschia inconspicua TaxID=303405 RepID=A0A9K3LZI5_9STRA|nr:2-isopropylmalate synthase [Nitzschia inconspicua]
MPSNSYYPPHTDDDDFTTDSGTVMTKALITPDGKCPKHPHVVLRGRNSSGHVFQHDSCHECTREHEQRKEEIRFQQLELERAMRSLDNASIGSSSGSTNHKGASPANAAAQPYRPPAPLSNAAAPGPYGNGTNPAPPVPFNPYDPYFAAALASHYQHHVMGGPIAPPGMPSTGDDSNNKYLVRMLEEKEEELKKVRKTLEETQLKLQEETLQRCKLEATLEQTKASFESERKVIELMAEKKAQEQLQVQQQEIFQKQLELMDKWQKGGAGAGGPMSTNMGPSPAPPPVLNERPQAEAVASSSNPDSQQSTSESSSAAVTDSTPLKNNVTDKTKDDVASKAKKKPWENGTNVGKFNQSMDNSLVGSAEIDFNDSGSSSSDDEDMEHQPKAPPPTPAERVEPAPAKKSSLPSSNVEPRNHFTPVESKPEEPEPVADDEITLGQTVASSTYGEDRIKVVNQQLLDPYGDKGVYTGVVLRTTGMPHGLGRMIYEEDGRIFEGDWRHGRWHGYGRASFSNGDSYEGEYKFDQRHGKGKYKWNDGRIYDGQFHEDKRHGKGKFTWPDGAVYDGEFVNGQREGQGVYTFADGGQYEGAWRDGRYEGFGTCTWEDGRRYRGEWRNGMAHGRGIETYPNGTIRHEGQWIDDEPVR